jgi:hypothetical protein
MDEEEDEFDKLIGHIEQKKQVNVPPLYRYYQIGPLKTRILKFTRRITMRTSFDYILSSLIIIIEFPFFF